MGDITVIQTTPEQLAELISKGVKAELEQLKKELLHENANDEILSREETAKFLKVNLSTLHAWVNKGKLQAYSISGSRRYFKRSEIMEALKQLKK